MVRHLALFILLAACAAEQTTAPTDELPEAVERLANAGPERCFSFRDDLLKDYANNDVSRDEYVALVSAALNDVCTAAGARPDGGGVLSSSTRSIVVASSGSEAMQRESANLIAQGQRKLERAASSDPAAAEDLIRRILNLPRPDLGSSPGT